jgi:hypothetical protein
MVIVGAPLGWRAPVTGPIVVPFGGASVGIACMLVQSTVTKAVEATALATADENSEGTGAALAAAPVAAGVTRSSVCCPQAAMVMSRAAALAVRTRVRFTPGA